MAVRSSCLRLLVLLLIAVQSLAAGGQEAHFYTLNRQNGLSDNCVLQLMQLSDGRMVTVTPRSIDIYDGQRFSALSIDTTQWVALPAYQGATHLFADSHDRLWMKQRERLYCFHLPTMRQVIPEDWHGDDDFFIDDNGNTWLLKGRTLRHAAGNHRLQLPHSAGLLQDVVAVGDSIYTFFDTGQLVVFTAQGRQVFLSQAYTPDDASRYQWTSLVVQGSGSCLYQLRTGAGGSVLLEFNRNSRRWRTILTSEKVLHTLTLTPSGILYLTSPSGYWHINPLTGHQSFFSQLCLPDGTVLFTGINTVCLDREGGFWLGTYDSGILYTSPLSGLFDTKPIDIEVHPILTTIYLHGQPLQSGHSYDGRVLLSVTPPYVDELRFSHSQNSLAFQFSTMNYVRPRSTFYRYRFSGDEQGWHTISADSIGHLVDDKGVFYLPLTSLSPGDYSLEVMASTNPNHWNPHDVRTIHFTIEHPWWQSPVAFVLYVVILVLLIAVFFLSYRRRIERQNREQLLLLRIQNLVDQVNRYEHSAAAVMLSEPDQEANVEPEPTPQEKEFMSRATALVEQHIADPTYNVEKLAADLCMERTGLYKKLTALIQQSPVAFIRTIRLRRAAALLSQGDKTIAEIAEYAGFCSPGYFSKCFQKEFGCKPSEYK